MNHRVSSNASEAQSYMLQDYVTGTIKAYKKMAAPQARAYNLELSVHQSSCRWVPQAGGAKRWERLEPQERPAA